jgi:hypothetical protein
MANISKDLVHQCSANVVKAVVDSKLVSFKRVDLGANSNTKFFGIKDGNNNDMFWVVLLDESSGFGHGYVNIIKKGNEPAKKQEAMVNAWKKVRKNLSTKKAGVALVDPEIPNNENPFPLTAKLVTEDKSSASKTPLGNLVNAVYNSFVTCMPDALPYSPTTATNPDYEHQLEIAMPHKTVWEYIYPSSLRESPTGETPDLMKVLAADLKDSCFIVRLTGVTVKTGTEDGKDVSIVKVCMKVHYIVEIPNLGAFIKVKKPAPEQDSFSGFNFESFTNGKSGNDFYKELAGDKASTSNIRTPTKKDKILKKTVMTDGLSDESSGFKAKKPRAAKKTNKEDEESPLKKPKKTVVIAEDVTSDDKLADEMDKLLDETPIEGTDDDEIEVVEDTQREDEDPVLKARKKQPLRVV